METLLPLPQSSVVCPTHRSPGHHSYLSHPNPAQSFPSLSSQMASISIDTPMSLPSSPLIVPQQHSVLYHRDACRPQDLQVPPNSFPHHFQPILTETQFPSSCVSVPGTPQHKEDTSGPNKSRQHSPPRPDQGEGSCRQSSGCCTQTELGETWQPNHWFLAHPLFWDVFFKWSNWSPGVPRVIGGRWQGSNNKKQRLF